MKDSEIIEQSRVKLNHARVWIDSARDRISRGEQGTSIQALEKAINYCKDSKALMSRIGEEP